VDVKLYTVTLVYSDTDGDMALIASDDDVPSTDQCDNEGVVKIFANVEKMVQQSARSTTEPSHFVIKLALVGSGGKKVDCSASLKRMGRRIVLLPRNYHDALLSCSCVSRGTWYIRLRLDAMHHEQKTHIV
jgi:hypothetical protein